MKQPFLFKTMQYRPEEEENEAKKALHEHILKEWQQRWQYSDKGAVTRKFFPTVHEKMENDHIKLDHYAAEFMTGHGDFRAKTKIICSR